MLPLVLRTSYVHTCTYMTNSEAQVTQIYTKTAKEKLHGSVGGAIFAVSYIAIKAAQLAQYKSLYIKRLSPNSVLDYTEVCAPAYKWSDECQLRGV